MDDGQAERTTLSPGRAGARPRGPGSGSGSPLASRRSGCARACWPARRLGHLAEREAQREGGHRRDRRAAEHAAQRLGQLGVRDGSGRDRVDTGPRGRWLEQAGDDAEQVVERDPAHVLGARADDTAEAQPERQQHLAERAARRAQHDADPRVHDADPGPRGRRRAPLPLDREAAEEVVGRRVGLASPRRRHGRRSSRPPRPRRARAASVFRPASVSARSRVGPTRLARRRAFLAAVQRPAAMLSPARCTTASTPSSAAASIAPASGSQRGLALRLRSPAHEAHDLVSARREEGHERAADETARAGDRYLHGALASAARV